MVDRDHEFALHLQKQFNYEESQKEKTNSDNIESLTDPSWELIDPTPNIHTLFMAFNEKFFWNKLLAVCVVWSSKMTSCAGTCLFQSRGGLCKITLSEPLLKLRPRKDLIETLLHEMIHAYLFVNGGDRSRDGHGPEFQKHMHRINSQAGTNISVYHNFHDEVRLYQQHWWRCNGPCQNRRPYFGMVRRATNRAPGPNDNWWNDHQRSCGGTYIKVKEPENYKKKKSAVNIIKISSNKDIRSFFPVLINNIPKSTSTNTFNRKPVSTITNSSSTVINQPTHTSVTIHNINDAQSTVNSVQIFGGKGQVLAKGKVSNQDNYAVVRNHWVNKFSNNSQDISPKIKHVFEDDRIKTNKKIKYDSVEVIDLSTNDVNCPICQKEVPESDLNLHLDQCLIKESGGNLNIANRPVDEDLDKEIVHEDGTICLCKGFCDKDKMISCLICNKKILRDNLNEHLDDCMGDDIFLDNNCNNNTRSCLDAINDDIDKKYNCPICFEPYSSKEMNKHLDECLEADQVKGEGVMNSFLQESF